MQRVKRPLTGELLDQDLVALLKIDVAGGARRQLQHTAGADLPPHDAIPRGQLAVDLLHPLAPVEENGVDRKIHEHHVDSTAGIDPHPTSGWKHPAKHE